MQITLDICQKLSIIIFVRKYQVCLCLVLSKVLLQHTQGGSGISISNFYNLKRRILHITWNIQPASGISIWNAPLKMQDESPLNPLDLEQSPSSSLPSPKSHLQFTSQLCICAVLCICAKRNWNREQVELCAPIFRPVLSNPVFFWQEFTFASAVQNKHSGTARLPIRVQLPQINKISVECNSCNLSTYLYKISPSWRKCLFFVVLAGGWKLYHDKLLMLMNLDQRHWYAARLAIFAHFETWDFISTRSAQQFAMTFLQPIRGRSC